MYAQIRQSVNDFQYLNVNRRTRRLLDADPSTTFTPSAEPNDWGARPASARHRILTGVTCGQINVRPRSEGNFENRSQLAREDC